MTPLDGPPGGLTGAATTSYIFDLWGAAAYQLGNTSSRTITEVKQR